MIWKPCGWRELELEVEVEVDVDVDGVCPGPRRACDGGAKADSFLSKTVGTMEVGGRM